MDRSSREWQAGLSYNQFESPGVLQAIKKLAGSASLTIVAGAGASVESGLPSWNTLVRDLLEEAAQLKGLAAAESDQFVRWTLDREDITGAGEIARHLLSKSFRKALHASLYREEKEPIPGETAQAIACLRLDRLGKANEVVTTNYDLLLEAALRDELTRRDSGDLSVSRLVDGRNVGPSVVPVRHVHGVLTSGDQLVGKLVLSDRDYHLMQDSGSWQESFFKNQLTTSDCLFVGTSLTDPNLLRYLYRSEHGKRHYALFVRQDDSSVYDEASSEVADLRERSQLAKWRAVNVEPLLFNHYAQSAQFLWEVVAATAAGSYTPLPTRLKEWKAGVQDILPTKGSAFLDTQERLQRVMAKVLAGTKSLLNGAGHRLRPGEKLGISLWVFDPEDETLVNWSSADRIWRDPSTLEPIPVDWSSVFVAVQAFCAGSMVSQSTSQHAVSRWNHVIGFPIYLQDESGRLPIGAVTLASTANKQSSLLERGAAVVRSSAIPAIEHDVSLLLDPSALVESA